MQDHHDSDDAEPKGNGRRLGRTLTDFYIDGLAGPFGLHPAEVKLLEASLAGEECVLSEERPESPTEDNRVRSAFLRFLVLGGDETAPVHEKGIRLKGAFIDDAIDLDYTDGVRPLCLMQCWIDGPLLARNSHFVDLVLDGSRCQGATFDDTKFDGNVSFRDRFLSDGSMRLRGAEIGGDLDMLGATLNNPDGDALACRRLKVHRSVFLTQGFHHESPE